jgi:hypothetical protein
MLVSKERVIKYVVSIGCFNPYFHLIKEKNYNATIIRNAIAQEFVNAGKGKLFEEMEERKNWSYKEIKNDSFELVYECGFTSIYEY